MSNKRIESALISVFYKDGLEQIAKKLDQLGVKIYSTGGTQEFIEALGIKVTAVEDLTGYPSILGGRVKTLHPGVFGGILARRELPDDMSTLLQFNIPALDLVIVDLYPFEETVKAGKEEQAVIDKIDIGGVSLIRAAAKNFKDVLICAARDQYEPLGKLLGESGGATSIDDRKQFAARAFEVCAHYDVMIASYFNPGLSEAFSMSAEPRKTLRYGENPHQQASFYGDLTQLFDQLHGKELSYNNLVDVDAAMQLAGEFSQTFFAIIKHTNVCGVAVDNTVKSAWDKAHAGDPESAFGGVLICNRDIDAETAKAINEIFFEVLMAPGFSQDAFDILKTKKNRILLKVKKNPVANNTFKSLLDGVLVQETDQGSYATWEEKGGRPASPEEKQDLEFANIICKHLKSNAICMVKNKQLIGKGCGQTSRIDALRQAIEKAKQFGFDLKNASLASDAFFPFDDCIKMGHEVGIEAYIQPGGSIRDNDSIQYAQEKGLALVMTGRRHFRH